MMSPAGLPRLRVVDAADVSTVGAALIADTLAAAVAECGVAHWATTGGSAAPGIYRALGSSPLRERVDWSRVHTWWGDDRFVPYDHPLSNVLPLQAGLLGPSGVDTGSTGWEQVAEPYEAFGVRTPAEQLHPWPIPEAIAAGEGPAWVAARYAEAMAASMPSDAAGTPVFDLVILGVGPDGHILSVFPGSAVWDADGPTAAVPAPTHIEPHVERVTFHPRVVTAARSVLVVTAGAGKAANLGRAWTGDDARELPVRAARLATATWVLDEAAATELPRG
jgi:6-phosphogluconolactonase